MSRELFLSRRLIEAAADPYAPPAESDNAAGELAAFSLRFDTASRRGYPVDVQQFERIRADDFSISAWLLLLDNAELNDPLVPDEIPDQLYESIQDEVMRLRLVSAVLGHPRTQREYLNALEADPAPTQLASLPGCWPKFRLLRLNELRLAEDTTSEAGAADNLREIVLYLLQDGTPAALALAAAAIAPDEPWRAQAHDLVQNLIRRVDPELNGFGAPFRRARMS